MIRTNNLTKQFRNILAVDSLSLTIESRTFFGFVGPNGAGKSTTVGLLTGMLRPTSGSIQILRFDLSTDPIEVKKRIGVMPEHLALFDQLTGEEHLTFVGKIYGLHKTDIEERREELLSIFDLESAAHRLIHEYSAGMKKKLAFAAAILHDPKILFLDEPFENVDPISRKKMKEILTAMRNKGVTVFLTSHALETVESLCDEVAIINKGKLVFQAKTEDIRRKIKDEVSQVTYQSLEEIFIDIVSGNGEEKLPKKLSWL